jgi:hypothetical protein
MKMWRDSQDGNLFGSFLPALNSTTLPNNVPNFAVSFNLCKAGGTAHFREQPFYIVRHFL